MQGLEALVREAQDLAAGAYPMTADESEVARQLQICNACRYCEGFCAVFPAMTRRLEFGKMDVHYLANLCHHCGACLHACQYAPPHEFAVNVPRSMARVRAQTYADYAWPPALGRLYQHNAWVLSLALALGLALVLALVVGQYGSLRAGAPTAGFYAVLPHTAMVALFAPVLLWAVLAMALGGRKFWRAITPVTTGAALGQAAAAEASVSALTLKYLDGGHGQGCHNADDAWTLSRSRAHHLTMYGFVLCLASTALATVYHYLGGAVAPYDLPSVPKVLGALGGVGLLMGTTALFVLHLTRHPLQGEPGQKPMDLGFIALLFLTSATGMGLWLGRTADAMPLLLALHLGVVMALLITLPYGKLVHAVYRVMALLRFAVEKRQPNTLGLGSD